MISRAELQYVNDFARNVPYPGDDYAYDVMEKLKLAFNLYNEKYQDKKYSLILSNGEEINFTILPRNLCHMLGIDYKNLTSLPMEDIKENVLGIAGDESASSYSVLSKVIEKYEEVINNDRVPSNYKILNYYKILIKSSIFTKLSDFTSFNFGCINFNKEEFNNNIPGTFKPNSSKFIFTPSDDALIPYYMMGMTEDSGTNMFVPETLFATPDFLNFFVNQELVVPIQLLINDNQNLSKLIATPEEKLNILKMYRSIIQGYQTNSYINIYNDYETTLRESVLKKRL